MYRFEFVFLLALLCFNTLVVLGQTGVPLSTVDPAGTCELFNTTSDCAARIPAGTYIYVNSTLNQSSLQREATFLVTLSTAVKLTPDCFNELQAYFCESLFMRCLALPTAAQNPVEGYLGANFTSAPAGTLFVPEPPCLYDCASASSLCAGQVPGGLPPCPAALTAYDLSTVNGSSSYSTSCHNSSTTPIGNVSTCLVYHADLNFNLSDGSGCPLKCPLPVFNSDDFDTMEIMYAVLNWVGFVGGLITVILLILDKERHKFPGWLIIILCITCTLENFAGTLTSYVGYKEMACENDYTASDSKPLCLWQAGFLMFFSHAITSWWLLLCTAMALKLLLSPTSDWMAKLNEYSSQWWFIAVVNAYGWGVPLAFTLADIDYYGSFGQAPFCLISANKNVSDFNDVLQRSLIIPMLVELAIGILLWIAFNAKLIYVLRLSKSGSGDVSVWKAHIRPILFLLVVFCPLVTVVIVYYYIKSRLSGLEQAFIAYAVTGTAADPPHGYYAEYLALTIALSLHGILASLLYGAQRRNLEVVKSTYQSTVSTLSIFGSRSSASRPETTSSGAEMSRF